MASEKNSLPLRVLPCSRQDGKVRYPDEEDFKAPSIAMWRNNLSALSHHRNLLFVAYIDMIYVYTPSFPEQTITTKPELIIGLSRSRSGLTGYLDPSRPHAVNHLIVGEIGDEEVVVVACDDGDVVSYTVRSIALAIEEKAKLVFGPISYGDQRVIRRRSGGWANMILPVIDPDWTPGCRTLAAWFHENVGASAWGLATHKRTMLLAVSSNTREIHVFAPSLSSELHGGFRWVNPPPGMIERFAVWETKSFISLRDRSIGRKVTLRGHAANIPNIAFCDNISDPEGRYLASTDIDGYTMIWDIWRGTRILEKLGNAGPHARGWGIACLDPRTSRLSEGSINTFGCACRVDESSTLIDNSEAGELVQNNSQWHPGFSALGSVPGMAPTHAVPLILQTTGQAPAATNPDQAVWIEDEIEDEVDEEMDEVDVDGFDANVLENIAALEEFVNEANLQTYAVEAGPSDPLSHTLDPTETEHLLSDGSTVSEDEDSDLPDLGNVPGAHQADQQMVEAAEENLETLSPVLEEEQIQLSDTAPDKTHAGFVKLPFNLLQTDQKDIHLFRDISFDTDLKELPPASSQSQVLCQQALNQAMPPGFNSLTQIERLNMIAQIPELGVVVIGNQVGRVGILTMTRWEAQKQSGYKIEAILPFHSEEEKGMRPIKPLMGMAVGPIQGQERPLPQASPKVGKQEPARRFRLMMIYCDHTILSYEISRPEGEEDILVV